MATAMRIGLALALAAGWVASIAPARPAAAAPAAMACFAEYTGDNTTDFSSVDASAVQSAVISATAGSVVKLAGTCAGSAVSYDATTQLVKVKKTLTLQGGYTDGAWLTAPSAANLAVLDAQGTGRVLRVDTGTFPQANITLENIVIQNARVSNDNGSGAVFYGDVVLSNTVFYSNTAVPTSFSTKGGAFTIEGGNLTITASKFISNYATDGGAVYYNPENGGALLVVGSQFLANTAGGNGAGIYINSNTATIVNTEFTSNTAGTGGGVWSSRSVNMTSVMFDKNVATGNGGGAYGTNSFTLRGITVTNNAAATNGGGLYSSGTTAIYTSTLMTNTAGLGGGAYFGAATVDSVTVANNTATSTTGGGVHFNSTSNVTNSAFRGNRTTGVVASASGAGAYFAGAATVTSATFQSNTSTGRGGGAYFVSTSVLSSTTFDANTSGWNGGGAYLDGASTVSATIFSNNVATGTVNTVPSMGGGAYFSVSLQMTGTQFTGNTAYGRGGGMIEFRPNVTVTIQNTNFYTNASYVDAGGAMIYAPMQITGGVFMGNLVYARASYPSGGGLYVQKDGSGIAGVRRISGVRFIGNRTLGGTSFGGALTTDMWNTTDVVEVQDSVFENNSAGDYGGAWAENNSGTLVSLRNVFTNNVAGGKGGAISTWTKAYITDTQFYANRGSAGGAIMNDDLSARTEITGSTFVSNSATSGAGGGVNGGGPVVIVGSTFVSNTATSSGGGAYVGGAATLVDALLQKNVSGGGTGGGGAGLFANAAATVVDSEFVENQTIVSRSSGNGAYFKGVASVTGTQFLSNTYTADFSYGGGAYFYTSAYITGSTFANNRAFYEGGLAIEEWGYKPVRLQSVQILNNWTSEGGAGGGFIAGTATLTDVTVQGNTSLRGESGLGLCCGTITVTNSSIIGNSSLDSYGGLAVYGDSNVLVYATRILSNTAVGNAAAIRIEKGKLRLVNSVVAGNRVLTPTGGAEIYLNPGSIGVPAPGTLIGQQNTIVTGTPGSSVAVLGGVNGVADVVALTNTIFSGYAIGVSMSDPAQAQLVGVLWENVTAPMSGSVTASGQVTGIAEFVNAAGGDYQANGDAIDAGIESGVAQDIRGAVRPQGAGYDLGAYEGGDAALSSLAIAPGDLAPAFISSTNDYTVAFVGGVTTLVVTATTSDASATVTYVSSAGACTGANCPVIAGVTWVTATVTGADGVTVRKYTIEVTQPSNDATLSTLVINPGTLAPAFESTTKSYTAEVPYGTTSTMLTPTLGNANAMYTITSSPGACSPTNSPATCTVQAGVNVVTVTVAAQDGTTIEEYTVEITVLSPSSNAKLALLGSTNGAIDPTFVSETLTYTLGLPYGWTSIVVFATLDDSNATMVMSSTAGACSGGTCDVAAGAVTTITVEVTAQDGVTKKTYVILVSVAGPDGDASLSGLEINPGTLAPAFVSTTTTYTGNVPVGTESVLVTATVNSPDAQVAYASSAGTCVVQGGEERGVRATRPAPVSALCAVSLIETTRITSTVTAQDGTVQEYVIVITVADANASTDATLSDLAIVPGVLSPAFVSSTREYAVGVPNGTTSMAVTATPNDAGATVAYASSAGTCAVTDSRGAAAVPSNCAVVGPKTWITVTVTAADGATLEKYSIEVTVAAPLTTIDRVWPGTGLPAGGMPVQIFGTGFVAALTVTVGPYTDGLRIDVPFVPVNDKQINFVMPAGIAGQRVSVTVATATDAQTAPNAFTYVQPQMIEFNGLEGGVFTTTDGVVVEIPSQGVDGMFVITMTPLPPAPGVPGNVLMYSFRLDALLNGFELETLTNPVTIMLPIDEGIFAISDGERPWLYSWTADGRRLTAAETTAVGGRRSAVGGRWVLVRGQEYDAGTQVMTVALRPMGLYALSSAYVREYWFPVVPVLK